jgi:hypothetical protein
MRLDRKKDHVLLIDPSGHVCKVSPGDVEQKLAAGWSKGGKPFVKAEQPKPVPAKVPSDA